MSLKPELDVDRARIGWWAFLLALAAGALYILWSFVGVAVLGVFGYYATRPIYHRIDDVIDSDGVAAWATILLVIVPVLLLAVYAGYRASVLIGRFVSGGSGTGAVPFAKSLGLGSLTAAQQSAITGVLQDPTQFLTNPQQTFQTLTQTGMKAAAAIAGGLILITLALSLSYFLLKNQEQFSDGLVELFGGRDTAAYTYASAVDRDLESVFFGNLLFVVAMAVIATATYWATNFLAPQGLNIPMVPVLGFLTGAASLIPIVVGKVIYLPVLAYLGLQAMRQGGTGLTFVAGALVAYFLLLDLLPQTFLQPYITGQKLNMVILLFAYVLGPLLFGWYGFFLMPLLFVLMLEAVRIVLPELVRGEPLTDDISLGPNIGSDPRTTPESTADSEVVVDEDSSTGSN